MLEEIELIGIGIVDPGPESKESGRRTRDRGPGAEDQG